MVKRNGKGPYRGLLLPTPEEGYYALWSVALSMSKKASQRMHVHIEQATELPTYSYKAILPQ